MNRLQPAPPEVYRSTVLEPQVSSARLEIDDCQSPCALFAPMHYEPNYAYPLLIWLHGPADDESQLKRIMPLISMRNYVAAGPRGTVGCRKADSLRERFAWRQTASDIAQAESRVFESLASAQDRFHIAPNRIFLGGFDCGGSMAFRLAMSHPDTFSGVLSLCGAFPRSGTPLARLTLARRLPVLLACGRRSQHYPTQQVCNDLRLLHSAGLDIMLREYPCGHEISPDMLGDMDRWMMEQIVGE